MSRRTSLTARLAVTIGADHDLVGKEGFGVRIVNPNQERKVHKRDLSSIPGFHGGWFQAIRSGKRSPARTEIPAEMNNENVSALQRQDVEAVCLSFSSAIETRNLDVELSFFWLLLTVPLPARRSNPMQVPISRRGKITPATC